MRSSKSRSRNKNNRRSVGNIVNRVFDSSGPEGKVRGTPQQIIDKYLTLARDAQLSNDRVALENFQQHAEHYTRMLSEALREQEARREQENQQRAQRSSERNDRQHEQQPKTEPAEAQPAPSAEAATDSTTPENTAEVIDLAGSGSDDSGLVETPESKPARKPRTRSRRKKSDTPAPTPEAQPDAPEAAPAPEGDSEQPAAE